VCRRLRRPIKEGFPVEVICGSNLKEGEGVEQKEK
jgi:hypothetical protein